MTGKPLCILTASTGIALAACANSTPQVKQAAMPTASAALWSNRMPVKLWPLKFDSHKFGAFCYDTQTCTVRYANLDHGSEEPSPPSAAYGPDYMGHLSGGHAMIRNFPAPARVSWRSRDGQPHEDEIDIGEIFADGIIRHNVSRDEIADLPDGEFQGEPSIILEVNDRTIRVWMRAMIFLKRRAQVGGVMRADFADELVLAKTYQY